MSMFGEPRSRFDQKAAVVTGGDSSADAALVTGVALPVDGGLTAR